MTEPSHRRGHVVDDSILAAVIEVIEAAGTLEIKVEDVARRAGVNKTTIYRRYPTREDLVLAAFLARAEVIIPIPDDGDLRSDLLAIVQMVRGAVTSPLGRALLSASALSPELAGERQNYWKSRFAAASEIISRAVERGECQTPKDPELLIELMVAPIHFRASQISGEISDEFLNVQVDRTMAELS